MNSDQLISLLAFGILTLLWLAFGFALIFNRGLLCQAWRSFRSWSWLIQLMAALLALPLVLALWTWNTKWPAWLRLLVIAGLAWVTEYTFFPAAALIS